MHCLFRIYLSGSFEAIVLQKREVYSISYYYQRLKRVM